MRRSVRIPDQWPRGLNAEQAAVYVGVSCNTFLSEVKAGLWPKAQDRGKRKIWDRVKIDEAWNQQHEEGADPFMEAINGNREA